MANLFIYYSLTGNGDKVAEKYKANGYDIVKLETQKPMPKAFLIRMLVGGFLAGTNKKTKLQPFDVDFDNYEKIAIGSPVWNGKLSSPINTLLTEPKLKDKNLQFILLTGSGKAPRAGKQIHQLFENAKILILKEPLKNPEELDKLTNFNVMEK